MSHRVLFRSFKAVGEWVYNRTGGTFPENICTALGLAEDGKIVAGVVYEGFNGASVKTHIAIDEKTYLTKEFLKAIFEYPFNQLKVNKLIGIVDATNTRAVSLNKKLGFTIEGVIEGASSTGDLLIMTMRRDQCRYLGNAK